MCEKNSCRTCPYEVNCRKVLWSQAREALWSNCKRTQSSESNVFPGCNKYELVLRSLRNNKPNNIPNASKNRAATQKEPIIKNQRL